MDAGATAADNHNGVQVDVAVTTVSDVDTLVVGDYSITYTAVDGEGNAATATRQVRNDHPGYAQGVRFRRALNMRTHILILVRSNTLYSESK